MNEALAFDFKTEGEGILNVLVLCEESQEVTIAFRELGHNAYSCDLQECSGGHPEWHIQEDGLLIIDTGDWDLMIAHPPCTYLTVANTYMKRGCSKYTAEEAEELQHEAILFFMLIADAPIKHIAIENPIGIMSRHYRKPDQIIQPYMFGDNASKSTCLWLKNLPELKATDYVNPRIVDGKKRWANQTDSGQNNLPPSKDRAKIRSKTYPGIAKAMASQWSEFILRGGVLKSNAFQQMKLEL